MTFHWLRRPNHQKHLVFYRWDFYTCCGGHLSIHAQVLLPGRGQCVSHKMCERVNAVLTVQNVYPSSALRAMQNQSCMWFIPLALWTVHLLLFTCWLRVFRHWWLLDIHFLCALHSSKACPKLYSNAFSNKSVLLSFCGQDVLRNNPFAVSFA